MRHAGVAWRSGRPTTRAVRSYVLLGALVLGCSSYETRTRTLVDQRIYAADERFLFQRPRADLRADEGGALIRAEHEGFCQRSLVQESVVEDRVVRKYGAHTAGVVLLASGGGLFAIGALDRMLESEDENRDAAVDLSGQFIFWGLVIGMTGLVTMGASADSEDTRRERLVTPVHEPSAARCSGVVRPPERVDVALPDGTLIRGTRSGTGLWRIPIDELVWQRFGERLDVDILVDGVATRRAVLTRRPQ